MFGERIRKERLDKGISQEELGNILNKTKNNISQYETEKRQPDTETLIKIADYFNCSIDYLLGRTDNRKGIIINDIIEGNDIEIEVNKEVYPEGLTHDEVLEVLEKLNELGIDWQKFKKK